MVCRLLTFEKSILAKRASLLPLIVATSLISLPVHAQEAFASLADMIPNQNIANSSVMMIIFVGAFAFAMWSATWLIRERRQLDDHNRSIAMELADLKARHERAQALLDVPDQRVVIWEGRDTLPVCRGTLPDNTGAPEDIGEFIAFGKWMTPQSAQSFSQAVERLRETAESFDLNIETKTKTVIEVQGRASGSHAFVRFIGLSGDRAALAALEVEHTSLLQTTDTMKSLLEYIPFPVWLRDSTMNLKWANSAYVAAVEGESLDQLCEDNTQLLDASERAKVARSHELARAEHPISHFRDRLPATISGDRRTMDVSEISYSSGTAGLAVDMSEVEEVQSNLKRTLESHAQTMNQLATAVAIFDAKKHLIFYNDAFDALWQLDSQFLGQEPDNGRLFDALREAGKIAEQPDWSKWRNGLLKIYEETQPQEYWWHLPDSRTLRVVANPHRQGGVTWVFENVTEQLEMESRYIALTQVQGETLDHLSEAIAVFSPDGRLKLSNPSFQNLWQLDDEQVAADTTIGVLGQSCKLALEDPEVWEQLVTGITGVSDQRHSLTGRINTKAGSVLDYTLVPLPNGQTMLSFADVSASVTLEYTLKERNEALEAAEKLKNAFIEHVSYEFRAPLTNIKGFAEVLDQQAFGQLNEKQAEYVDHITTSANVLHGLVDNLLDLATVDAGIMELDFEQVDLRQIMRRAASSINDQLKEQNIQLSVKQIGGAARFVADAKRIQQVLYNLLTNAIAFSPDGGTVTLESRTEADAITLTISDTGPGIAEENKESIFDRFSSATKGNGKRGAGLGLAISRSLVELHGGEISVHSQLNEGTSFICRFPKEPLSETTPTSQAAQ